MQIQQQVVKIQNKGLLTIPKAFREELELSKDSLARITKIKGRLILEPIRTLPYKARSYKKNEIDKFFKLDKNESKSLKNKGLL